MRTVQKVAFSLLIAVVLFAVFAVLAFSGLFDVIESRFYNRRITAVIEQDVLDLKGAIEDYTQQNNERFSAFLELDFIRRAYLPNRSREDIFNTENGNDELEREIPGLLFTRFVDDQGNIHFSTYADDIKRRTDFSLIYDKLDNVDPEIPFQQLSINEGDAPDVLIDGLGNRLIFRLPFYDNVDLYKGTALFYISSKGLRDFLIRRDHLVEGDSFTLLHQLGYIFNGDAVSKDFLHQEILAKITQPSGAEVVNALPLAADETGEAYHLFFSFSPTAGYIGYLADEASFSLNVTLRYILLTAFFLTTFLIMFLIFNFKQDKLVVLSERVKRFQINFLKGYIEKKDEVDWEQWKLDLSRKRERLKREIKSGVGKLEGKTGQEVDTLIEKSWDEILGVIGKKAEEEVPRRLDVSNRIEIENLERIFEKVLTSGKIVLPTRIEETVSVPRPVTVEELPSAEEIIDEEVDEIEEVEAVEELADAAEEIEAVEAVDEIEEVEAVEELTEAAEEIEAVEAVDEIDDEIVDEIEEVDAVEEAAEAAEEIEAVEAVDEIDDEVEEAEEGIDLLEMELEEDLEPDDREPEVIESEVIDELEPVVQAEMVSLSIPPQESLEVLALAEEEEKEASLETVAEVYRGFSLFEQAAPAVPTAGTEGHRVITNEPGALLEIEITEEVTDEETEPGSEPIVAEAESAGPPVSPEFLTTVESLIIEQRIEVKTIPEVFTLMGETGEAIGIENGVYKIKEEVYTAETASKDTELKELVREVVGEEEQDRSSGIDHLFSNSGIELPFFQPDAAARDFAESVPEAIPSRQVRFDHHGFNFQYFSTKYTKGISGELRAIKDISKELNAIIAAVLTVEEDTYQVHLSLGMDGESQEKISFNTENDFSRYILSTKKFLFMKGLLPDVETMKITLSENDAGYINGILFIPFSYNGQQAYLFLGMKSDEVAIEQVVKKLFEISP